MTEREKARKRKHKGSTGGTAVGAKPGGTKGNKQISRVQRTGKEDTGNQVGKNGESQQSESGEGGTEKATVRRKREERGKEETEAE